MSSNYVLEFEMLGNTADLESALPGIEKRLRDRFGKTLLGGTGVSAHPDTAGDIRGWFRSAGEDEAIGNFSVSFEFAVDPGEEGPAAFSSLTVVIDKRDASSLMPVWEMIQLELEQIGLLEGSGKIDKVHRRVGGRPPLSGDELLQRLRKANMARRIKQTNPEMTWREIVKEIDFEPNGTLDARVKRLYYARLMLERVEESKKPEDIELLKKVADME